MDLGHDMSQAVAHDAMYAGELSFARRRYTRDLKGVDIAIVGIPLDLGTANRHGARFGPRAIREQSSLSSMYPWGLWPWKFTFDIDFLDPAYAPGVGTPVVGGPSTYQVRQTSFLRPDSSSQSVPYLQLS